MKKFGLGAAILAALLALAVFAPAFAAHPQIQSSQKVSHPVSHFKLEHRHGVARATASTSALTFSCTSAGATSGNLVINVTEKIKNDADSGQAGNYWALDTFTRTIKVWNVGSNHWCAVLNYNGTFAAQAGQKSPGTTGNTGGILTGDEVGTIKGGAQFDITGPLDVSNVAVWPLKGNVNGGTVVDYGCAINPDGSTNGCPGYVDWTQQYFDQSGSFTINENPWGWTYVGHDVSTAPDANKPDGVWHNFSTGNSGDILDVD